MQRNKLTNNLHLRRRFDINTYLGLPPQSHTLPSHFKLHVCLSVHRCICVEKKNHLDATEWFIALMCSTCFGHFYAHHQELETICVLLTPIVCNALVAGGRRSGAGSRLCVQDEGYFSTQVESTYFKPCFVATRPSYWPLNREKRYTQIQPKNTTRFKLITFRPGVRRYAVINLTQSQWDAWPTDPYKLKNTDTIRHIW